MTTFWYVVAIVLLAGTFFGLVIYRTWQDRREERRTSAEPGASREAPGRKTA